MQTDYSSEGFTQVLNQWIAGDCVDSANKLKAMLYYHLKSIIKTQIDEKAQDARRKEIFQQLPNTTSFLHDVLLELVPPAEMFDNRQQYFLSLAQFVRWMLLDHVKKEQTQKRSAQLEALDTHLSIVTQDPVYLLFEQALTDLEKISPRTYQIASLHYYLGHSIANIQEYFMIKKSTAYNELAAAKAYLRIHCDKA